MGCLGRQPTLDRDRRRHQKSQEEDGDPGTIVFDTSAVIDYLRRGEKTKTIVETAEKRGDSLATTTISLFELLAPLRHRRLRREEKVLKMFARQATLLELNAQAAEEAAEIMGALLRLGRPINAIDVLICGTAISNNADSIVTSDHDFEEAAKVAEIEVQLI